MNVTDRNKENARDNTHCMGCNHQLKGYGAAMFGLQPVEDIV